MGCFYTGFDWRNRKNGYYKNGETGGETPAKRLATIRHYDAFQCLGWIHLIGETKAERLLVESYVRVMMERHYAGVLVQVQNDHFEYNIIPGAKYEQAQEFADTSLRYAIEACEKYGIRWEMGKKKYKTR